MYTYAYWVRYMCVCAVVAWDVLNNISNNGTNLRVHQELPNSEMGVGWGRMWGRIGENWVWVWCPPAVLLYCEPKKCWLDFHGAKSIFLVNILGRANKKHTTHCFAFSHLPHPTSFTVCCCFFFKWFNYLFSPVFPLWVYALNILVYGGRQSHCALLRNWLK